MSASISASLKCELLEFVVSLHGVCLEDCRNSSALSYVYITLLTD